MKICYNCFIEIPDGTRTCPHCGSGRTYLVQGNEFIIKEISAE